MPENPAAAPTIEPAPASAWQDAATAFGLLSSTVRLHLLWELARGERDVGTLRPRPATVSPPSVSISASSN